jgi:tetratricopeptide (TPR) repeat protein
LVWSAHPLTTASVTYLSQRTELLMALCYLGTVWSFLRSVETGAWGWRVVSVATCVAGMMSKEVMVSAPLVVLLYDRTFVSGSFANAWRLRRGYYIALSTTWLVLAYLLTSTGLEQRTVGFGHGVSPWTYAFTECEAWARYAALALWPAGLVFDYGPVYTSGVLNVVGALLVLTGLGFTIRALRRNSANGFLGACVLLLLAPTSSFIPVADQPIAENRMYLPLAAVVVLLVSAAQRIAPQRTVLIAALLVLAPFCALTISRNADYADVLSLWRDTLAKRPQNHRAHFNMGVLLLERGRPSEAAASFERAIHLRPGYPEAHNSLGNALLEQGRVAEATRHYAESARLQPSSARAWYNVGNALLRVGNVTGALQHLERAVRLKPNFAEAHNQIGNAYFQSNQPARAIDHYESALRFDAALAEARYNCGSACLELGRNEEAIGHFTATTQLQPADAEIRNNLGVALLRAARAAEAIVQFEHALRLKPDYAEARSNLELARANAPKR